MRSSGQEGILRNYPNGNESPSIVITCKRRPNALHDRYKVTETLSCLAIHESTDESQARELAGFKLTIKDGKTNLSPFILT